MNLRFPGAALHGSLALLIVAVLAAVLARGAAAAVIDVALANGDGEPASGQIVTLRNVLTGFETQSQTNTAGRARFTGVPSGTGYAVVVDGVELAADIRLRLVR